MISRLYLNNCFRHHDRTFTFEKGLTGIVGPNESGKSLILEMIAFALFGSVALRGDADDYKTLHVELDFMVAGETYTVTRKGSRATLDGPRQASGTKPVNQAIVEILGYDFKVFTVANACRQNDVEALTSMRPADRKAMVDKTIGLDVLDTVINVAGQKGNALKREAETIFKTIGGVPPAPVEPEGYQAHEVRTKRIQDLEKLSRTKVQLRAQLAAAPAAPVDPGPQPDPRSSADLLEYAGETASILQKLKMAMRRLQGFSKPTLTLEEVATWHQAWDLYDAWQRQERLLAQGEHRCPACDFRWPVAEGVDGSIFEVPKPRLTRRDLEAEAEALADLPEAETTAALVTDLQAQYDAREKVEPLVERMLLWEQSSQSHEAQVLALAAYREQVPFWEDQLVEIGDVETPLEEYRTYHADCMRFETLQVQYEAALETYETNHARALAAQASGEDYLTARANVQALKTSVKTMLLPSLNQRASQLLNQMTAGERYAIVVDEDFEITVDTIPVHKLSGSAKAIANLAVRIALGQMLTSRVFSIFCVDEVDASMDPERAAATAEALARLKTSMDQVFIVTHKRPDTDHLIELKK